MKRLVELYPAAWRQRYEREFVDLLEERPARGRDVMDIVLGAIDARVNPQLTANPSERVPVGSGTRIAGIAAILGGLVWCGYLGLQLVRDERSAGDWDGLLWLAFAFMLLSLPGAYMTAYPRQLGVGVGVAILSLIAFNGSVLPWGLLLLVPGLGLVITLVAGTLALAAARAGLASRTRWLVLALVFPGPVLLIALASAGVLSPTADLIGPTVAVAVPYGLAWIAMGTLIGLRGAPMFDDLVPASPKTEDLVL